jgi:hypothetical protein
VDEDRVDVRHVDAALDDRRAEQNVGLLAQKAWMRSSSWCSGICPWATMMRASGTARESVSRHRLDRAHAVVDEEDLTAAAHLAQDRLADQALVEAA